MSSPILRAFARSLLLVPFALSVHIGAAAAADSPSRVIGDAQESARQLLLGTTTHTSDLPNDSKTTNLQHNVPVARLTGDAQESARQLLVGATTHTEALPSPEVSKGRGNRMRGDAQVAAQHLLLGRRDTP